MRFLLLICILLSLPLLTTAQDTTSNKPSEANDASIEVFNSSSKSRQKKKAKTEGLAYFKEFSVGGKITTSGWSFLGEYTIYKTFNRKRVYQFEFMEIKHPKQQKLSNEVSLSPFGFDSPKSFVYGKQNNFYVLHFGYGAKYLLGDKAKKSGVEVNFTYTFGPSIGLTKPYYLNIIDNNDNFLLIEPERYDPEDPDRFLSGNSIYGASGFSYGLSEIRVIPGGFAKAGFNFDWANYSEFVKSLEAGIGADIYIKDVPIMIVENNKPYYVYLYLGLQLGKKW